MREPTDPAIGPDQAHDRLMLPQAQHEDFLKGPYRAGGDPAMKVGMFRKALEAMLLRPSTGS